MKQQLSDWPDVRQLELDYLTSAEISKRGKEPDRRSSVFHGRKDAHSLTENLTAGGSLVLLDRDTWNTKEEAKIVHIIKV